MFRVSAEIPAVCRREWKDLSLPSPPRGENIRTISTVCKQLCSSQRPQWNEWNVPLIKRIHLLRWLSYSLSALLFISWIQMKWWLIRVVQWIWLNVPLVVREEVNSLFDRERSAHSDICLEGVEGNISETSSAGVIEDAKWILKIKRYKTDIFTLYMKFCSIFWEHNLRKWYTT